jgi:tetratricopeptide (TPR) repeat protein
MLAFDRAAGHYRKALDLWLATDEADEHDEVRRSIGVSLGDALANAGRGVEAAEAYQQAVVGASTTAALKLKQRAAEQLLISGHVDQGIELTRQVLSALGMKLPRTPLGSLLSLLFRRLHLRMRGVGFKERDLSQVPDKVLVRGDTCRSVGIGLAVADHIKGADFSTRYVLSALETGESNRVILALLMEANYLAASARSGSRYHRKLVTTADALLGTREDYMAMAYREGAQAYGAFMAGAWMKAKHHAEQGIAYVQKQGSGWWELAIMRQVIVWSLFFLGELKELTSRVFPLVQEAQDRGDLFAVSGMMMGLSNVAYLNQQGPEQARMRVAEILQRWSVKGYHLQHWYALLANIHIDLYQGEGLEAHERLSKQWPLLRRSLLLMIPSVHNETLHMRGRASLASVQMVTPSQRRRFLSVASKDARRLSRRKLPLTTALAGLLRAGVAAQRGKTDEAVTQLEEAINSLDAADTRLYSAAARRRLGVLVGGDAGEAHLAAGNAFMEAQGVKDPERMTAMLVPGFGD